jgi:hypothetical protein
MTEPLNNVPSQASLSGAVEKIIKPSHPGESEQAEIVIQCADGQDQEIRIENILTAKNGDEVSLKEGALVGITIKRRL